MFSQHGAFMEFNRILLVQTAFLGDTILTTPLIRAVRQLFPQAQIDILVIPQTAGVLRNNPHLNHIILFDKRADKKSAFVKTLKRLKSEKYDLAVTPHSSFTTGLLLKLACIPHRIGFDRNPIRFFLTQTVPVPHGKHTIEKNLALLRPLSKQTFSMQTELFITHKEKYLAQNLLQRLPAAKPKIAIAPGSVWPTKRWPKEYYARLVKNLKDDFALIFIGSDAERDLCAWIIEQAGAQTAMNLAGELSLLQSAAIIEQCDLMICNDSGALHLANAMQTDVFAFFGPTVKEFGFYPFRPHDFVFEVPDLYCRPCGKHGSHACPQKHFRCMLEIEPKKVEEKVRARFTQVQKSGLYFK